MADRTLYLRLNTKGGVHGTNIITGAPGGDIMLTEDAPVCDRGLPESFVRKAKLQRAKYHIPTAHNRPARDVPRYLFSETPFPPERRVVQPVEEEHDEIPLVVQSSAPQTSAASSDADEMPAAPEESPKSQRRARGPVGPLRTTDND